jgi:SAM-dependent methyltransferase
MAGKPAWYETFFGGIYTRILGGEYHEQAAVEEAAIVRRALRLRRGQHVLDIPCGQGRLTLILAKWGLAMTGVDLTASYLRRARRRAKQRRLAIRFIQADMRRIDFDGEFDAALNWFGSFGYFSAADNLTFVRRVYRALKPGGKFLVEGPNKTWLLSHFRPRLEETVAGIQMVHEVRFDRRTSRVRGLWTMTWRGRTERHQISMEMYNGTDIRRLLRAGGFRNVKLLGRAGLRAPSRRFTKHSRRFLAVATKA